MFGLAVGDALGCTLEFLNEAQINHMINIFGKHKDIKGGGPFYFEEGEVTDDTDMSICVANGIINNYDDPITSIGNKFLKWVDSNPKDVGMTVRQSLMNFYQTGDWEKSSFLTHQTLNGKSGGNGSLMRCLPIALAYKNIHKISLYSMKQSKLTHYDTVASNCCVLYNQIAYSLLRGIPLKDALLKVLDDSQFKNSLYLKPNCQPDTYVVHTFEWMCYLLNNTHSFEESVVEAVNLGYDADTLGAVVGGLSGIFYGFENIPRRFIEKILKRQELEDISDKLFSLREKTE